MLIVRISKKHLNDCNWLQLIVADCKLFEKRNEIQIKGENQKMERNKVDILQSHRSEMNFIGKLINEMKIILSVYGPAWIRLGPLIPAGLKMYRHLPIIFRNQHLASCCQTPMARSVSDYVIITSLYGQQSFIR